MMLDAALLNTLACPADRSSLRQEPATSELICTGCGLAFPLRDGIAVLMLDEARQTKS